MSGSLSVSAGKTFMVYCPKNDLLVVNSIVIDFRLMFKKRSVIGYHCKYMIWSREESRYESVSEIPKICRFITILLGHL